MNQYSEHCKVVTISISVLQPAHTLSIVLFNMCNVLFSYACTLTGQGFICRYIFMVIYSFVPQFREAKFCGVPRVKKWLRNTGIDKS
jgi:hypothetical protein